jgi:hypothetical protein
MADEGPRLRIIGGLPFAGETLDWEHVLKGILKAELGRQNLRYPDLVKRLAAVGVIDNEPNLRNKISRGNFSALFLLQCLMALGVTELRLPRYPFRRGQGPETLETQQGDDDL